MRGAFNIGMCFLLKAFLFTIFMSSSAVQKITQRQVSNRECFIYCLVLKDKCGVS